MHRKKLKRDIEQHSTSMGTPPIHCYPSLSESYPKAGISSSQPAINSIPPFLVSSECRLVCKVRFKVKVVWNCNFSFTLLKMFLSFIDFGQSISRHSFTFVCQIKSDCHLYYLIIANIVRKVISLVLKINQWLTYLFFRHMIQAQIILAVIHRPRLVLL